MGRTADTELLEFVTGRCETQSTVDIALRGVEEPFYFSTNVPLALDNNYTPRLLKVGELKETGTQATNRVQVTLSNTDLAWGLKLASDLRQLELAGVVIKRLYRSLSNPGVFQHKHFFSGKLVGAEADEKQIVFDVIPKPTAAGLIVATRTLSPRCAWIFKDPRTCRYAGVHTTCNQLRKSSGGCRGRENEEHNGGFAFPENPTQAAPGSGGNPGPGVGSGQCFFEGEMVETIRGEQPIETIRPLWRVRNFNRQTMEIEVDTVEENGVHVNFVTEYFEFVFSDGSSIRTTAEEPFFDRHGQFIPARELRFDSTPSVVWRCVKGDWRKVSLKSAKRHSGGVWKVYNLSTMRNKTLFVGGFAFHNKDQGGEIVT